MAGIRDAISDILNKLSTLTVINNDQTEATPYVRVWNNQLKYDEEGQIESFPKPAFFVEAVSPTTYEVIGQGFRSADVDFSIHVIHEYYNDADGGTYEQDLLVFDLRDMILQAITYFRPAGCGPMTCILEEQDTSHNNLYHYVIHFVVNFTDSKGSRLDPSSTYFKDSVPPTEVDIVVGNYAGSQPIEIQNQFIIPTRNGL